MGVAGGEARGPTRSRPAAGVSSRLLGGRCGEGGTGTRAPGSGEGRGCGRPRLAPGAALRPALVAAASAVPLLAVGWLGLRRFPEITFEYDSGHDATRRVEELLAEIDHERRDRDPDPSRGEG